MSEIADQAQGRWHSILSGLGVDQSHLTGKHCACPVCGGKDRFRFDDMKGRGTFFCTNCGAGDGFNLLMNYHGWDFKQTADEVKAQLPNSTEVKPKPKKDPRILLKHIARNCVDGTEVVGYLQNRGLNHFPGLRQCKLGYYDNGKYLGNYQSMIALIVDVDNEPVSYHVTYLENRQKAKVPSPKKVMPGVKSITGCAVRFGNGKHICVTEGIETALAVRELTGLPVWAAINAGNLEKIEIPEDVERVDIFADNDMHFAGHKSAYVLANRLSLKGVKVTVEVPNRKGTDFADQFVSGPDSYAQRWRE